MFLIDFEYSTGDKGVSFDGDADRIVYFYKDVGMILPPIDLLYSVDTKYSRGIVSLTDDVILQCIESYLEKKLL